MNTIFRNEYLKKEYKEIKPMSKTEYLEMLFLISKYYDVSNADYQAILFWPNLNAHVPSVINPFKNPESNAPSDPKARAVVIKELSLKFVNEKLSFKVGNER
ncbi:hypothetical protein HDR60_05450 [bacterium]|nr:hypothetical protein [bacterium]